MALFNKFSTKKETTLVFVGIVCAFLQGLSFPIMMLFFGDFTDTIGTSVNETQNSFAVMDDLVLKMLYISLGVMVATFVQSYCMNMFSENLARNMKMKYIERCLAMDAAWYDEHNPTEMQAKIVKEVGTIQRGVGDKISLVFVGISALFGGFALAFTKGWKLTLILFAALPFLAGLGGLSASLMKRGVGRGLDLYAQSAGYAEQAISAMKVVHTYGNEELEHQTYKNFLQRVTDSQLSSLM
jgi:ATP-binding cassette subfamily B (MDR/TAP) protein 1